MAEIDELEEEKNKRKSLREKVVQSKVGDNAAVHTLTNCISRGKVLEQNIDGAMKTIPLVDLLPLNVKGKRGTYTITIEFKEEK